MKKTKSGRPVKADRAARLDAALKANLARRKAQARARGQTPPAPIKNREATPDDDQR